MKSVPEKNQGNETGGKPLGLTIPPYAVETLTDLERRQEFTSLNYRHKRPGPRDAQIALIGRVLDDLAAAGVAVTDKIEIRLTPQAPGEALTEKSLFRIRIEVPVAAPPEPARIEVLRVRYGRATKWEYAARHTLP